MELLEILGFFSALIIGISLGLIGGGGSILAVPVLAYLFSVNEKVATAYSLFIVGASALVGGLKRERDSTGFVRKDPPRSKPQPEKSVRPSAHKLRPSPQTMR